MLSVPSFCGPSIGSKGLRPKLIAAPMARNASRTPKWTRESKLQRKENVGCRLCQQACKRSVSGCVRDKRELYSLFLTTGGTNIPAKCIPSAVSCWFGTFTAPNIWRLSHTDCKDSEFGGSSKLDMNDPDSLQSTPRNKSSYAQNLCLRLV